MDSGTYDAVVQQGGGGNNNVLDEEQFADADTTAADVFGVAVAAVAAGPSSAAAVEGGLDEEVADEQFADADSTADDFAVTAVPPSAAGGADEEGPGEQFADADTTADDLGVAVAAGPSSAAAAEGGVDEEGADEKEAGGESVGAGAGVGGGPPHGKGPEEGRGGGPPREEQRSPERNGPSEAGGPGGIGCGGGGARSPGEDGKDAPAEEEADERRTTGEEVPWIAFGRTVLGPEAECRAGMDETGEVLEISFRWIRKQKEKDGGGDGRQEGDGVGDRRRLRFRAGQVRELKCYANPGDDFTDPDGVVHRLACFVSLHAYLGPDSSPLPADEFDYEPTALRESGRKYVVMEMEPGAYAGLLSRMRSCRYPSDGRMWADLFRRLGELDCHPYVASLLAGKRRRAAAEAAAKPPSPPAPQPPSQPTSPKSKVRQVRLTPSERAEQERLRDEELTRQQRDARNLAEAFRRCGAGAAAAAEDPASAPAATTATAPAAPAAAASPSSSSSMPNPSSSKLAGGTAVATKGSVKQPVRAGGEGGGSSTETTAVSSSSALGLLTRKFLDLVQASPTGTANLAEIASSLQVPLHRVREVANTLVAIGLLDRPSFGAVSWKAGGGSGGGDPPSGGFVISVSAAKSDRDVRKRLSKLLEEMKSINQEETSLDRWIEASRQRWNAWNEAHRRQLHVSASDVAKAASQLRRQQHQLSPSSPADQDTANKPKKLAMLAVHASFADAIACALPSMRSADQPLSSSSDGRPPSPARPPGRQLYVGTRSGLDEYCEAAANAAMMAADNEHNNEKRKAAPTATQPPAKVARLPNSSCLPPSPSAAEEIPFRAVGKPGSRKSATEGGRARVYVISTCVSDSKSGKEELPEATGLSSPAHPVTRTKVRVKELKPTALPPPQSHVVPKKTQRGCGVAIPPENVEGGAAGFFHRAGA